MSAIFRDFERKARRLVAPRPGHEVAGHPCLQWFSESLNGAAQSEIPRIRVSGRGPETGRKTKNWRLYASA